MSFIDTMWNWIQDYYPLIVFVAFLLIAGNFRRILSLFKKKPKKVEEKRYYDDVGLFEEIPNAGGEMEEQKILAEKWVGYLKNEAIKLQEKEKELQIYFFENKNKLQADRQKLSEKYSNWAGYLRFVNDTIDKKQKMTAPLRR